MKIKWIVTAALLAAAPAFADEAAQPQPESLLDAIKSGKPMTSFRLRYEKVEQDGLQPKFIIGTRANPTLLDDLDDGKGLTLRSLVGWQTAPFHDISIAAQLIDVHKFNDDYNDSTNSTLINGTSNQFDRVNYAKIVDPDYTGVNQLYVDWTGIKDTRIRAGRQQLNLDNVRFVGDIGFRQVMQVFDGVSLLNKTLPNTDVFLARFERVRQITTVLRSDGGLNIANVKYRLSPTESIVGYAYLSSFDDLGLGRGWFGNAPGATGVSKNGNANESADQSNKVFGLRLDGVHKFGDQWKALYTAEYAKQSDYAGGDSRIDAHYYKVGGGAGYGNFSLRADQELLSSNNGAYAFQTPFGTNHLFQGWVDKFLATPPEGIRDTFVSASYKLGDFTFFADYHWIDSDEDFNTVNGGANANGSRYGKEWNVSALYAYNAKLSAKIEYGKFTEGDHYAVLANTGNSVDGNRARFRDTDKLWLTLMYTF